MHPAESLLALFAFTRIQEPSGLSRVSWEINMQFMGAQTKTKGTNN